MGFLHEMASYGDLSHMEARGLHFYLINHPQLIQNVLVTHHRSFVKSRALQVARQLRGHHVQLEPLITLRPKHGLRMTLHRRGR